MGKIRKLFTEKRKVMSQKSISDLTGSSTPVESSDYIESFLENKNRFLPPINFATASNFAKFGSAKQYSIDSVSRVYGTYPYDGSMAEKIDWLNRSNFYDLYIFNNRYPRTCGYAVFSPDGWGTQTAAYDSFGLSSSPEYIKFKGGPHPDPNSGSLKLSRQFPSPYDGKANIYDPSAIERESNLALDVNKGVTIEFWFKYSATTAEKTVLNSLTTRQVLFDLWNGMSSTTEGNSYGRLIAYQDGSGMHASWRSGSLMSNFSLSSKAMTTVGDGNWHHIAVTAKAVPYGGGTGIEWNDFIDGQWCSKGVSIAPDPSLGGGFFSAPATLGAVTGSMIATLGAARLPGLSNLTRVAGAVTAEYGDGWGKISGSIDEFRYWKTARTPQEISRFWFTQIGGGTNTDNTKYKDTNQPVDLGVYYKFNEGNTGNDTVDATVLDYSGRITNGTWNGFISGSSRVAGETASAMIESSAAVSEFKDPIIYSSHPEVSSLYNLLSEEGESWDLDNNMALYHTMPEWITSEDQDKGGEQLKKLTQIVASYLDTLYLQISAISDIKNKNYPYQEIIEHNPNAIDGAKTRAYTYTNSPSPFARNLLDDGGLYSTEIFSMVNDLAALANRDEYQEFEQSINDVKNTIYQNIYNNLDYILKSKGTEKSFRNLIRCYGVDDELIKINLYASDATYSFNDADYRSTAIKKKYIDFNEADRTRSTMYQSASHSTPNSISYIPGWNPTNVDSAGTTGSAMTFEADVIFPKKYPRNHPSNLWYSYPYLTSSVFGCHTAQPTVSSPEDFSYPTGDSASFSVYSLRDKEDSETVRFMLSSSNGEIPNLTTDYFQDVYDDQRWLFAVKVHPLSPLESQEVSGSTTTPISGSWQLEFKGYNPILDQINNSFSLSTVLTAKDGTYFMNANKRVYAGAERRNFSGSLLYYSDVKIGAVRVWDDEVDDFDLMVHAKDPSNYGRSRAYRSAYLFDQPSTASIDTTYIPEFETLLLNWDFNQITGSTAGAYLADHYGGSSWNGSFEISNYASGSDDEWQVPARYKYHYTGRGDWFLPDDTTSLVDLNFLSAVKTNLPEASSGEDMISILDTDDDLFVRDSRPVNHYFAIEKSMNAIVSEQMLNMFATTLEFNNLVGEPVNRYRMEYKSLGKMREAFFRKVGNTPDFNKFIDFYKWIDDSLTDMLEQLVPMSANFSDGVKNMIESHILERNKYWTKFPTLELKAKPIVGRLKGINELTYDWEHGHAKHIYYPYQTEGSVEFVSGSSQYIDFGDEDHWTFGDESDDSPFSISCWIKFDDLDTANMPYYIMGKNSEYRVLWGNSPQTGGGQGLCFVVRDFSGAYWLSQCIQRPAFATIVSEREWHHYAFVYDGDGAGASDISIYVDGVLWGGLNPLGTTGGLQNVQGASHGSYVAMHNTTNEFQIGRLGGVASDYFDGKMDELAIFNGALSAAQVSSLYNNGYPVDIVSEGIGTLAGYWKLGDSGDATGANGIKDSSGFGRHGTANAISGFSTDIFSTGRLPKLNQSQGCLWWKERAESSGSFSGDLSVDANRNTMRRVLTSDVTTNKILATGEYTDPINYPNSGFPDAAEINLAQSGDLGSRVQYKGSTYALRSFSKPYKMEAQKHIQLHGGINSPDNQRRDATKTSLQQMMQNINYRNYIYAFPTDIDDLKDCDDILDPNEKKHHAFAMYPFGITTAAQKGQVPFAKGTHFAPFNLVSSSVTTNTNLVETDIELVNLHTDGYGNNSEIPMQGPFTERHVGGMAHRHHDINDGTHNHTNRSELFRINISKDVYVRMIPGNRQSTGHHNETYAFDQFYRDGVAKRPVNIRNILTTTDSALSQSALGNYDNDIQILNTHNQGGKFLAKLQAATGSDGFYTVTSPAASLTISDISDSPKTLAVAKTLLESATPLVPPYAPSQFNPYISKNNIIERFSAPGDPSTAGDAFGGFGIDKEENKYAVYNALPWRNRQVRFPTNALLTAHCGIHGSFSGSSLSVADATTALTASFHKTHRNTDYVFKHTSDLTAFRSNSVYFGGGSNHQFYASGATPVVNQLRKISLSAWIKTTPDSSAQTIFSFGATAARLQVHGAGSLSRVKLEFDGDGSDETVFRSAAGVIEADRWYHIVVTFDQGDAQEFRTTPIDFTTLSTDDRFFPSLYINGEPAAFSFDTTSDAWNGAGSSVNYDFMVAGVKSPASSNDTFDGYIQDISLWNTILSPEQVKEIHRLPGYDSAGPGDLTRLDYVSTNPKENNLVAWYQFNSATNIQDVAPVGNALNLQNKLGSPSVNTDHFLPANYYGTECGQRHDNYFIQHPIPANDFGYAWITASADHSVGCELISTASFITASEIGSYRGAGRNYPSVKGQINGVHQKGTIFDDFVGLNINIFDPVSGSENFLGYAEDWWVSMENYGYQGPHNGRVKTYTGIIAKGFLGAFPPNADDHAGWRLNGLLLRRNGPYGYPSWKQIRGGNHPIVRQHKKTNTLSVAIDGQSLGANGTRASRKGFTNFIEPAVSRNLPLIHRIESVDDGIPQEITLKHTYANNLCTFSNNSLKRIVIKKEQKERQVYDDLKDMYLAGEEGDGANAVKSFKSMVYSQIIYPRDENKYLSGSRARLNYAETDEHISENKNGEYRTFWKDSLDDRARSEGSLNSMGYRIYSNSNLATNIPDSNVPDYVLGKGTLSVWPLDVGSGNTRNYLGESRSAYGFFVGSSSLGNELLDYTDSQTDDFGGTWGELNRDPNASLFGSLTTTQLNTLNGLSGVNGYTHFMSDTHIKCHATASQCIDFYDLAGVSWHKPGASFNSHTAIFGGYPLVGNTFERLSDNYLDTPWTRMGSGVWSTAHWSGRSPWYNSYEDYSSDIRPMAKEYTVLPEFKISDHIEYYIQQGGFKNKVNNSFLSLEGASLTSSARGDRNEFLSPAKPYAEDFFKEYSHSDFMRQFELIQQDHEEVSDVSVISLKCSAVKKLLPYNGFYPVQRCLQLGALMSSSYAPYLSGSAISTYGADISGSALGAGAERLQSFLQPFYAPGIMYNSIKSGIAVDYPIHTSSADVCHIAVWNPAMGNGAVETASLGHVIGASSSHHVVMSNPDYRIPFEALIDPDSFIPTSYNPETNAVDRMKMFLTAPYYGSSSFYAQWLGNSKPFYKLAMNNFSAEVPNFFLKNKNLTTFRSAPQSEFTEFKSGTTYYMDVVLQKTPDFIMSSHYNSQNFAFIPGLSSGSWTGDGGYSQSGLLRDTRLNPDNIFPNPIEDVNNEFASIVGWGYGPKYHVTGTISTDAAIGGSGSLLWNYTTHQNLTNVFNSIDPSFAPHAPPYLYGRAVTRMAFKPHEATELAPGESARFSLEKILDNVRTNIDYQLEHGVGQTRITAIASRALKRYSNDPNRFPAKDNVMRVSSSVNLFGTTNLPQVEYDAVSRAPRRALSTRSEQERSWVIHTKWETPALNFAKGTGGPHLNIRGKHDDGGAFEVEPESEIRSVEDEWWKGNSIPPSLRRPLGMWKGYGTIPESDSGIKLSLAESFPAANSRSDLDKGSLIQACGFQPSEEQIGQLADYKIISEAVVAIPFLDIEGERKFFALGNTKAESKDLFNKAVLLEEGPGRSIINMAEKLPNYILPPHLDFLNDDEIEPFAMYIFEFTHKLSQQDLSNIWQNVMPDIAVTAEKAETAVTHASGENEFFRGNKIPDNTRWMVFKVKRRSASNYFKMTADSKDDHRFNFLNYVQDSEMERYNYNWPYDFFSLVELAKVEARIGIGDDAIPIPPKVVPLEGSALIKQSKQVIAPLVAKPTVVTNSPILGSSLSAVKYSDDTAIKQSSKTFKQAIAIKQGSTPQKNINASLLNVFSKLTGGND